MGDFLKPEVKKFILPVILIILFLLVINAFRVTGSVDDKYNCQIVALVQQNVANINQNDTAAIDKVNDNMKLLSQNKQKEMKSIRYSNSIFSFIKIIDPIVPFPCESFGKGKICMFYESQETYNCLKTIDFGGNIFSQPPMNVYKPLSIWIVLLNILVLFIEGYLVSSIVLFFYGKMKDKQVISSGLNNSSSPYFRSYTLPPSA